MTDPYIPVKNRTYFALRNGIGVPADGGGLPQPHRYLDLLARLGGGLGAPRRVSPRARHARSCSASRRASRPASTRAHARARRGRPLAAADPAGFLPYPGACEAEGGRLALCLRLARLSRPHPMGGIARYTADLARGLAAAGHDVHVVTRSEPPLPARLRGRRLGPPLPRGRAAPAGARRPPAARQPRARGGRRARRRRGRPAASPLDVVAGNVWIAETLFCALDPALADGHDVQHADPHDGRDAAGGRRAARRRPGRPSSRTPRSLRATAPAARLRRPTWDTVRRDTPAAARSPAPRLARHGRPGTGGPLEPRRCGRRRRHIEILFVGRLEPRKGVDDTARGGDRAAARAAATYGCGSPGRTTPTRPRDPAPTPSASTSGSRDDVGAARAHPLRGRGRRRGPGRAYRGLRHLLRAVALRVVRSHQRRGDDVLAAGRELPGRRDPGGGRATARPGYSSSRTTPRRSAGRCARWSTTRSCGTRWAPRAGRGSSSEFDNDVAVAAHGRGVPRSADRRGIRRRALESRGTRGATCKAGIARR